VLWRRSRRPATRVAVVAFLAVVALADAWRPRFTIESVPWAAGGVPPVYDWLAAQPGRDGVLELPVGLPLHDADRMVLSARHWKPLVNGYSGFTPTMAYFRALTVGFPTAEALRALHAIGVRWIVVHPGRVPPAQAGLCTGDAATLAPHLARVYEHATACVLELRGAPPPAAPPADRPVPLSGATVTTAAGEHPAILHDASTSGHWVEPVRQTEESWVQIDLPAPRAVSRVVLALGPHFGEYMRVWRVDTSADGVTWQAAAFARNGVPPLVGMRDHPAHLTQELRLPAPAPVRHLRVVRPDARDVGTTFDLWNNWTRWGIHEIELFEAAS
jgi:hypothetical protein